MPIYHSYETMPSDDLAQANQIEMPDTLQGPSWNDFLNHLQMQGVNPLTIGSAVVVGFLAQSKRQVLGLSTMIGIATATYHSQQVYGSYDWLMDGGSQTLCNILLAFGCYVLKRGWQAFNRAQREMDDCESYLQEMNNPALIGKSDKLCPSEPVRSKIKLDLEPLTIRRKAKPKPWRLNLVQKIIVSLMLPVLMVTGVKALTAGMMTFQSEYWWFWLGGLSVLLLVELWLWRGKASIDKNID
jgi:hypothetical protein